MSFKVSWIGFDRKGKAEVLQSAGLHDTGEPDEANEAPFSGAEMPGGWFILFANDFDFVSRKRLAQLSADCRVVGCQVHEGVMVSAAYGYERGNRVWELVHDGQRSMDNLSVFGAPPPSFDEIRRRLTQQHEAEAGGDVDYIFDIPVDVAAAVCNYRHDRWGIAEFTRLAAR